MIYGYWDKTFTRCWKVWAHIEPDQMKHAHLCGYKVIGDWGLKVLN